MAEVTVVDYAVAAVCKHRLSVIPIGTEKRPKGKWAQWQMRRMSRDEALANFKPSDRMGIVCGVASDHLEAIDFDIPEFFDRWRGLLRVQGHGSLLNRLVIQGTPSGGCHVLYRCEVVGRNQKLAMVYGDGDRPEVAIETRAEGGYIVAYPSSGYTMRTGKLSAIPEITAVERDALPFAAKLLNEVESQEADAQRPGDEFNADRSWADVLEPHGWRLVREVAGRQHWARPGKEGEATSATTGNGHDGKNLLKVFSSNAHPFATDGVYDKFAAFTLLNHGGDFRAAAARLSGKTVTETATTPSLTDFPFTDLGNAERMLAKYGEDIRFCSVWGRWLLWDGSRWQRDETGGARLYQMAHQVVRDIQAEAAACDHVDKRKAVGNWGFKCEDRRRIENMVEMAKTMPGVSITPGELDRHPDLLNVRNGTIDLRTGELRPHKREDLITCLIDANYDLQAECTRWQGFLHRVLDGSEPMIKFVWKALGYSLCGDTSEKCFFFLHGSAGNNGKSVFIETILSLIGEYARQTSTDTLMVRKQAGTASNDVARLKEARFVAAPETENWARLNEAFIKRLTGGDTITARFLHQEFFEFVPNFKIWMTGNHRPQIRGTDDAIWNRVCLIPFQVVIPKEEQDPDLRKKLLAERDGILTWLVRGCLVWRSERLGRPEEVVNAVAEYREENDVLGQFLQECTRLDINGAIPCANLFDRYQRWCESCNEKGLNLMRFGIAMKDRGEASQRSSGPRGKAYVGRALI